MEEIVMTKETQNIQGSQVQPDAWGLICIGIGLLCFGTGAGCIGGGIGCI